MPSKPCRLAASPPATRQASRRPFLRGGISAPRQEGRWRLFIAPLLLLAAIGGWWLFNHKTTANTASASKPLTDSAQTADAKGLKSIELASVEKIDSAGVEIISDEGANMGPDPRTQQVLLKRRLERMQAVLDNYRQSTRYPYTSRPIAEHPDQVYPNQPVVEVGAFALPGEPPSQSVRLRTSQERIYLARKETSLLTVSAIDNNGNTVPLQVVQATAFDPPQGGKLSTLPQVPVFFNDTGIEGDTFAGDGVLSYNFNPTNSVFDNFNGHVRIYATLKAGEDQFGIVFFDVFYTPEPPAEWAGDIRESLENGSLNLYLKAKVRKPGRYVVTGRVDDAGNQPFALVTFNDEMPAGTGEIKLTVFGKLVQDQHPTFPLRLRDVDAFLLKEDVFPDRDLMPRLAGAVYATKAYPLGVFSDEEWQSEERDRHLREFMRMVNLSKEQLDELNRILGVKSGKGG